MKALLFLLSATAVLLLGYCGFALVDSWMFQHREGLQLEQVLQSPVPPSASADGSIGRTLVGRLEVPRLGVSVIVVEGDGEGVLRHAAGHIPGTALPGETGNIGISAHRDTFFRPLRNIRADDAITLITLAGEYRYKVVSTTIVTPDDIGVLRSAPGPAPGEVLTLVTCYPFYFVGPAPKRFIVRAERVA